MQPEQSAFGAPFAHHVQQTALSRDQSEPVAAVRPRVLRASTIGPKQTHPDFVVLHPRRGLLILETKDWRLDTIQSATPQRWDILADGSPKTVINPLAQARHCAIQVVNALERDAQLVQAGGPHQGKLAFPWGHGVVFTRITRRQFESSGLGEAIEPHLVICADKMHEGDDAEQF